MQALNPQKTLEPAHTINPNTNHHLRKKSPRSHTKKPNADRETTQGSTQTKNATLEPTPLHSRLSKPCITPDTLKLSPESQKGKPTLHTQMKNRTLSRNKTKPWIKRTNKTNMNIVHFFSWQTRKKAAKCEHNSLLEFVYSDWETLEGTPFLGEGKKRCMIWWFATAR